MIFSLYLGLIGRFVVFLGQIWPTSTSLSFVLQPSFLFLSVVLDDSRADGAQNDRSPSPSDVGGGHLFDGNLDEGDDSGDSVGDGEAGHGEAPDDDASDGDDCDGDVAAVSDESDDEGRLVIDEDAAVDSGLRDGARPLFAAPDDFPSVPRDAPRSSVSSPVSRTSGTYSSDGVTFLGQFEAYLSFFV
ncbi:MAG: hypothetical protein MUC59_11340 [Saprospiraceae bacterium]|nr:hypothetical protein [Saprospiraceae bacterium]